MFSNNHDSGSTRTDPYQPAKWRLCVADPTIYHLDSSEVMQQAVRPGAARHTCAPPLMFSRRLSDISHTSHHWSTLTLTLNESITKLLCAIVRNVFVSSQPVVMGSYQAGKRGQRQLDGTHIHRIITDFACVRKTDQVRASRGCRTSPAPAARGPRSSPRWCRCG